MVCLLVPLPPALFLELALEPNIDHEPRIWYAHIKCWIDYRNFQCLSNGAPKFLLNSFLSKLVPQKKKIIDSEAELQSKTKSTK